MSPPTSRFVLRYRGEGAKPEADVARVRALADASVLDDSPSRMLLVESPQGPLRDLVESLDDWVMAPEQAYQVPDTRKKVERPPG
jgi:hypothetical protein